LPACRLMAITADDATNLETALIGPAIRRDVPVVLRLFDGDFADRIQRAFNITVSRSVSYLAPPFAAHICRGRCWTRYRSAGTLCSWLIWSSAGIPCWRSRPPVTYGVHARPGFSS
jgi:hypothetical protein